jgi:hypothetical protein
MSVFQSLIIGGFVIIILGIWFLDYELSRTIDELKSMSDKMYDIKELLNSIDNCLSENLQRR